MNTENNLNIDSKELDDAQLDGLAGGASSSFSSDFSSITYTVKKNGIPRNVTIDTSIYARAFSLAQVGRTDQLEALNDGAVDAFKDAGKSGRNARKHAENLEDILREAWKAGNI